MMQLACFGELRKNPDLTNLVFARCRLNGLCKVHVYQNFHLRRKEICYG
jgi:hypothetical protein